MITNQVKNFEFYQLISNF